MTIAFIKQTTSRIFNALNHLQPLWWFGVRLWIAVVFFKSGLVKIDDFETTILLFAEEYNVPFIPPELAAYSGTFFELTCPVLLTLGFGTRFAALTLLAMTAVIQFTYLDHVQHYYWAILLTGLIIHGGGKWSLDRVLLRKFG
ncbi:MAG: DoxX family protein [Rickettsiales bacterium]